MNYFSPNWLGLNWSPWISFNANKVDWQLLPKEPGLYRVRAEHGNSLVYVGETGRTLRERLSALRKGALSDLMPFNDPHTAAPNLWAWRQEEHWQYECSVASFSGSHTQRKALECLLLWKYRLEKGESTLCNHGRFHKRYSKSTDRSKGRRGVLLQEPNYNPSWGPSYPALKLSGEPLDSDWMGLNWSRPTPLISKRNNALKNTPAIYKIFNPKNKELTYIGQTKNLHSRFLSHCRSFCDCDFLISYCEQPTSIKDYQLHELENDLIAAYYQQTTKPPICQFRNSGSKKPS